MKKQTPSFTAGKLLDHERYHRTTLSNGVRVVTEHIPSVRSISVGLWVFTGSRDEAGAEAGISHFIEHMVFKGTRKRPMRSIASRMEAVGGYLNAFTSKEYTCYYARALDEHLGRAIDLICDLILNPLFPEHAIEKEIGVVLEEMLMYEDTPEDYIFDAFEQAIYGAHPMGRPVLGRAETVRAFTRERLVDYLERHYTPDRFVLAVAGHVDHQNVVRLAERAFAGTGRTTNPLARETVSRQAPVARIYKRPIQQAHLVLGTQIMDIYNPKRVALSVLHTLLGGGMSSRLNQRIREKYGYCYAIYSFFNLHADVGDFGIYMGMDPSRVERARKLILREVDQLAQKPVSNRMLRQTISQVKGNIMLGLESMSNRMMRLGRQELYFNEHASLDQSLQELASVTAADVQDVAQQLLEQAPFTSVVLLPERKGQA